MAPACAFATSTGVSGTCDIADIRGRVAGADEFRPHIPAYAWNPFKRDAHLEPWIPKCRALSMRARLLSASAGIGRSRSMRPAAKGPRKGIEGTIRAAIHTARDQDQGVSSRGERFSSPYVCSAKRPLPRSGPLHHGDAGAGQPPKMKRLPPPLPHGGFPFGAPTRPPWRESPPRPCRALSAGPMPSRPIFGRPSEAPSKRARPLPPRMHAATKRSRD